jgi:hypothetical protein
MEQIKLMKISDINYPLSLTLSPKGGGDLLDP